MENTWILGAIVFVLSIYTCFGSVVAKLLPTAHQYIHQVMNGSAVFDEKAIMAINFIVFCSFILLIFTVVVAVVILSEIKSNGK